MPLILYSVVLVIHVAMGSAAASGDTADQVRRTVMNVARATARVYLSKLGQC